VRVFVAGIMQGSRSDHDIDDQSYRLIITKVIKERFPQAEIVDPWALHPDSVNYGPEEGRQTFLEMSAEAARCDLLVAYLPTASMGTAIEIWEAYRGGKKVISISPMKDNWVIKFLSDVILPEVNAFAEFVKAGGIEGLMG
jgi:hypothetical protein